MSLGLIPGAAEAKTRYDLKLHNVDQNYVYIDVLSKSAVDRADFIKARLVLNKDTFLPRQMWFETPNTGEILESLGYEVDISVAASIDYSADGGPDYSGCTSDP